MVRLDINIQPITYIDPKDSVVRTFPGGYLRIFSTDTVRDDGARLYTDMVGNPIVYIKEVEPNTEPCVICGLYDGEMSDSPLLPEGVTVHKECASRLWDAVWGHDCNPKELMRDIKDRIGREVRYEKGVQ